MQGVGAIYVLTENRKKETYHEMWNGIFELCPNLQQNCKFIMSDYEAAAVNVAKARFPNARVSGCFFHYKQVNSLFTFSVKFLKTGISDFLKLYCEQ